MPAAASRSLASDESYQEQALPGVSRTFALTIPELPGDLRRVVTNAYLLCRIADTIEDDNSTPPERRAELLEEFLRTLHDRDAAEAFPALVADLQGDAAHLELLHHTDLVLVTFRTLPPRTQERVAHWVRHALD